MEGHLHYPLVNFCFRFLFADPPADKPSTLQIPFSRTPNRQNTLDEDITKPEKENASAVITKRMNVEEDELSCPSEREAKFELFPIACNNNQDCEKVGRSFRCCKLFGSRRCHEGLEKQLEDIAHERKNDVKITRSFPV